MSDFRKNGKHVFFIPEINFVNIILVHRKLHTREIFPKKMSKQFERHILQIFTYYMNIKDICIKKERIIPENHMNKCHSIIEITETSKF